MSPENSSVHANIYVYNAKQDNVQYATVNCNFRWNIEEYSDVSIHNQCICACQQCNLKQDNWCSIYNNKLQLQKLRITVTSACTWDLDNQYLRVCEARQCATCNYCWNKRWKEWRHQRKTNDAKQAHAQENKVRMLKRCKYALSTKTV